MSWARENGAQASLRAGGTHDGQVFSCACGATRFVCTGKPIMVTECYCESCRNAGAFLEALPGAPAVLGPFSGTHFAVQRKDRVAALSGTENLREHRLTPESKTRRVVATCCNTPMFLDFADGHWFSIYAGRFAAEALPAVEERTMLNDVPDGFMPPPDARNSQRWSLRFFSKLFAAWAAMRFRTPKNDWGREPLA